MPIADEKVKSITHRVTLVTMTPARNLTDLLVDVGSGVYEYSFIGEFNVISLERNGTALTEVFATPTVDDTYYWDPELATVQVKLAAAPNSTFPLNMIMANYRLQFKDNETFERELDAYHNRITRAPRFRQSVSNTVGGVITIAKQNLGIANSDGWMNTYLTQEDIFYNRDISVNFRLNNQEIAGFVGKMGDFRVNEKDFTVDILDKFIGLRDAAGLGDSINETYNRSTGVFYKDFDKPIPYFFKQSNVAWSVSKGIITVPDNYVSFWPDTSKMERAVSIDFNYTTAPFNNRNWQLGRGPAIKTYDFGTVTGIFLRAQGTAWADFPYIGSTTRGVLEFQITGAHNIEIGDVFTIENNSGITHQFTVFHTFTTGFRAAGTALAPAIQEDWSGNPITAIDGPCVIVKQLSDGKEFICQKDFDYTLIETPTSGGNKSYSIEFFDNFESNATHNGLLNTINPETHEVYYRLTTTQDPHNAGVGTANHKIETVLDRIFSAIGLTYDSGLSTITDNPTSFSIPFYGESDYGTYLSYLENLLGSVPAYCFIGADTGQVIAKTIGEFLGNEERADDEIETISTSFDTSTVYSKVIVRPKYSHRTYSPFNYDDYNTQDESDTQEFTSNLYRFGIDRTKIVNSLMESGDYTLGEYLAAPIYKVRYNIGMSEIESTIGNGRVVTSKFAIGQDTTINGNLGIQTIITQIDIGADSIGIEAINIKGVT